MCWCIDILGRAGCSLTLPRLRQLWIVPCVGSHSSCFSGTAERDALERGDGSVIPLFFLRRQVRAHARNVPKLEVFVWEHAQLGILGFIQTFSFVGVVLRLRVLVLELPRSDLLIHVLEFEEAQRVM